MSTEYKIIRRKLSYRIDWQVFYGKTFMKSFDLKRDAIDWVIRQEARDARQKM